MRVVTKKELLAMEPPVLFRPWVPNAYDYTDWTIKTGNDFGAINLSPDPTEPLPEKLTEEEIHNTWDWDGKVDIDDDETFVVAEKKDISLMAIRLADCFGNDHNDMSTFGVDATEYYELPTKNPDIKFKGWNP